ncbi:hypothetical protein CpecG_0375 [Chlamydia pecorum MC/MarsBar]|nr:hypothetical protein CpecS_0379 [Chlamydia pecorum VR629]ETF39276.1 hypothetical protein CpecF_0376 [Chlamydia pecorum DBDeUG]ETF39951.1 hypothetical protein CpecG_0375 [Chlamydia pecorum MC/MarsBar]ETF40484.1 hypothetical protein CpecA_0377 [Chlamydia pecorum IPTaLE]
MSRKASWIKIFRYMLSAHIHNIKAVSMKYTFIPRTILTVCLQVRNLFSFL